MAVIAASPANEPANGTADAGPTPQAASHLDAADAPQVNGYADSGGHVSSSVWPVRSLAGGQAIGMYSARGLVTM